MLARVETSQFLPVFSFSWCSEGCGQFCWSTLLLPAEQKKLLGEWKLPLPVWLAEVTQAGGLALEGPPPPPDDVSLVPSRTRRKPSSSCHSCSGPAARKLWWSMSSVGLASSCTCQKKLA